MRVENACFLQTFPETNIVGTVFALSLSLSLSHKTHPNLSPLGNFYKGKTSQRYGEAVLYTHLSSSNIHSGDFLSKNRAGHGPAWSVVLAGNGMWHKIRTAISARIRAALVGRTIL
jgi:hypothetical protein